MLAEKLSGEYKSVGLSQSMINISDGEIYLSTGAKGIPVTGKPSIYMVLVGYL